MIEIDNLTVAFSGKKILDGVSLNVAKGETLVLMGKNGSGKSVLLKAVAGLIERSGGSIRIGRADIENLHSPSRPLMAYVFQKGGLFDSMNVFENTAFGLRRMKYDEKDIIRIAGEALERVGLGESQYKLPSELSGGMQKRVGLARAVCMNPQVILYDDPTAGLDPILSDSIADLMIDIRETLDSTSIVVTHDLKVAEKIAHRAALLYGGKIVFSGTGSDFFLESDEYSRQFIEGEPDGPIDIY